MTNTKLNKRSAEKTVRDVRRATRRNYSPEEKNRIVLEGLRDEEPIAALCRKQGINQNLYEAGKKPLAGDAVREATSNEVKELRSENLALKEALAEFAGKPAS